MNNCRQHNLPFQHQQNQQQPKEDLTTENIQTNN